MSQVSSLTKSSYPYRGTLAEIDTNGDGVVSQQELAAARRPGLLKLGSVDQSDGDGWSSALSSIMAMLVKGPVGQTGDHTAGSPAASDNGDMQTAVAAYQNTYGQYDFQATSAA